ncbi:phosphatase [Streptomyces sp. M41(2017)]|uniref:SpoIIE family protein phosphatase n=1 Tax=Streptomyces sp. M41(2017) TaxID=1955065 RepID=UPI0009C0238F|nr:SpoIIE family protein phosphatase [Streptomyces sp. M41(2017)]OQQ13834.1 phosphatase [Streptomyces sp. M41(2017)]
MLVSALSGTVQRTGASAGFLYLLDEAGQTLEMAVSCGLPAEVVVPWHRVPLETVAPVSEAVREARLVWVGSQEEMARTYPRVAASVPYRFALAAAPLSGRSRCWGGLVLLWPASHPARATRREQGHITTEARRIAHTLDRSVTPPQAPGEPLRLPLAETRSHTGRTPQAAADYAERLPEGALALDLEGRITFMNSTAATLLGHTADRIVGTRPWQSMPWLDQPAVEDHYRTAVISREQVEFTTRHPSNRLLRFQLYPDASGISVRVTEAADSDRPPHGLGVDQPHPTPSYRPMETTSRNAPTGRLYQLLHLASALTETVAVSDVVELVSGQVLPAFGADGLVISAADAGRLKITGWHGYSPETVQRLDGLPVDTDITPAGHVLTTGIPLFVASPQEMARDYPRAPVLSDKKAWAFLPLLTSGQPVGCCILSYDQPHTFSADERAVLTSLSGLIAQALDRAQLYDAVHNLALGLQEALLPRMLPKVPGLAMAARYLPASRGMDIGGDFYDVVRLNATTIAAVIGDVQGHNVAAAALMGQVRTAIHATADAPPNHVLAHTNRVMADLGTDLLVSCLYIRIDLRDGQATLASAGHPPPLLHQPGRPGLVLELDPAPPLGIDIGAPYPVTQLSLPLGGTLALYTDGLTEVPGTDADQKAADLAEHLGQHHDESVESLIDRLIHHAWPTGRHTDDTALLLLRRMT